MFRTVADHFVVKAHQLGPNQVELTAKKPTLYVEGTEDDLTEAQRAYLGALRRGDIDPGMLTPEEQEEKRLRCLQISANRAKTQVRKHCKAMGADTLLTLTYKANVTDIQECKEDLRRFVKRLRAVCPDFRAVACFERQQRGAWHVHLATPRLILAPGVAHLKSFNLIRSVWRSVTGDKGGNIDVQRRKHSSKRSAAKIAAYLSKYLVKAFEEGESHTNRWTRFGGGPLPPSLTLGVVQHAREMIELCYGLLGDCCNIASAVWSKFGDWFYLAGESPQWQK